MEDLLGTERVDTVDGHPVLEVCLTSKDFKELFVSGRVVERFGEDLRVGAFVVVREALSSPPEGWSVGEESVMVIVCRVAHRVASVGDEPSVYLLETVSRDMQSLVAFVRARNRALSRAEHDEDGVPLCAACGRIGAVMTDKFSFEGFVVVCQVCLPNSRKSSKSATYGMLP
jgi:hypothetical protein